MLACSAYLLFAALCLPFCAAQLSTRTSIISLYLLSAMATYAITDGLHAALPTCWSYLTSSEKNGMVGWLEAIDEATRTEYILGAGRTITVGTPTDCTHHIRIDGIKGIYFEISIAEDVMILENMAIPVMFVDGAVVGKLDLHELVGTCHIVLPEYKV
ncbi:hypothetical protein SYNPS1DRAFT_32129 [Syncephalis pseudoplumigaleata]|uniref:Uncharacterized protein n=1 Tax=Syncephalis pseudoplumigaleata TaxID=1712513 RepID=A0A4P9YSF5_9FUNG|nr:hypothetical protein SYNPS1DRAFT_32129 [Syncephalis pseudoplumigaleata]|eukprot:RKP22292.1 hypothetical protein SYNPS1DRAFT_32129 [Syncephalis pseudoplumigaleata]